MKGSNGYEEQFQDWSERFPPNFNGGVAHEAAYDWQATADLHPPAHPWLNNYPVHALWQTALPLCNGARPWTQVLSVGEPRWTTSHPHLCPADNGGTGARAVGPPAEDADTRRGVVRHWLRVTQAPCRQITRSDVVGQRACSTVSHRRDRRCSVGGQHAGTRRERSPLPHSGTGGGTPCTRR